MDMEYLNYFDRQELITERSRCRNELNQLKIKKEDETEKTKVDEVIQHLTTIILSCDERLKAQKEDANRTRDNALEPGNGFNGQVMIQSMQNTAKQQQIIDTVRAIRKLKTGDCIETFVCGLNQLYRIEVRPHLTEMPTLETDFVNCAMSLLTYPMFTQLEKSGKEIKTWEDLEKYLIATHGTRISNFQHLHRLWNCQLRDDERFADFGSRLEDKIYHASMHIQASFRKSHSNTEMNANDVFGLVGAMLAAQQLKAGHEDAFKSLIKTIDKHWSASSLLQEAADYSDKLETTTVEPPNPPHVTFHTKVEKRSYPKKGTPKSDLKKSKKSSDRLEDYKKKCSSQICENFLKGHCKYGKNCFRIHPVKDGTHYAEIVKPEVEPEVGIENLFHQGPEN